MLNNSLIVFCGCTILDLQFSSEQEELLQEEIAELDDAIACHIHVLDAVTQEIVGTASVQLWVMVEDSVNILRQVSQSGVCVHPFAAVTSL